MEIDFNNKTKMERRGKVGMMLEIGKEMDRRCVLNWLTKVYATPSRAFDEYTEDDLRMFAHDAIVLLKEQEVELSFRKAKAITHTATKLDDATCPSCGNVVGEKIKTGAIGQSVVQVQWDYCLFCGQKLDWKGR